jgi:hypothetical protein
VRLTERPPPEHLAEGKPRQGPGTRQGRHAGPCYRANRRTRPFALSATTSCPVPVIAISAGALNSVWVRRLFVAIEAAERHARRDEAAHLYRRVGHLDRARAELAGAAEAFRTLRMTAWLTRAEAELAEIGAAASAERLVARGS